MASQHITHLQSEVVLAILPPNCATTGVDHEYMLQQRVGPQFLVHWFTSGRRLMQQCAFNKAAAAASSQVQIKL